MKWTGWLTAILLLLGGGSQAQVQLNLEDVVAGKLFRQKEWER